jgi:hypothetical protein
MCNTSQQCRLSSPRHGAALRESGLQTGDIILDIGRRGVNRWSRRSSPTVRPPRPASRSAMSSTP